MRKYAIVANSHPTDIPLEPTHRLYDTLQAALVALWEGKDSVYMTTIVGVEEERGAPTYTLLPLKPGRWGQFGDEFVLGYDLARLVNSRCRGLTSDPAEAWSSARSEEIPGAVVTFSANGWVAKPLNIFIRRPVSGSTKRKVVLL